VTDPSDQVISYTTLRHEHVPAAAELRGGWVQHGLYSLLGPPFWRVFLTGLVEAPDGVAFAALNPSGDLVGYSFGTTDIRLLHAQILKGRRLAFARAALRGLLAHPWIAPRVLRGALRPMSPDPDMSVAQWPSVNTAAPYRRRGVAEMLARLVSAALHERGLEDFDGTVELDNDASNAFMTKRANGRVIKVIKLDDLPHNLMRFPARPLAPLPPGHRLLEGPGMPQVRV
jgi:hypothetical protein